MRLKTAPWLVTTLSLTATLNSVQARGEDKNHSQDSHRNWANPDGVLVSNDGGRVNAPEKKDKDADDPPPPAANEELAKLVAKQSQSLTKCLAELRSATPELQKNGARYGFRFEFIIAASGSVGSLNEVKKGGSAPLPDCAIKLGKELQAHAFLPPSEAQALDAHVTYDAVILSDDEAQGRGFQYIAGEDAWEATLKSHKDWFQCKADTDCTVTAEACELKSVAVASLVVYRREIAKRKKPPCYKDMKLATFKPSCRLQRCSASRVKR